MSGPVSRSSLFPSPPPICPLVFLSVLESRIIVSYCAGIFSSLCIMSTPNYENDELLANLELVNTEPMTTEPISKPLSNLLPVSSEPVSTKLTHLQTRSSELLHSQSVSSDPVHSEPISSEQMNFEPVSLEVAHSDLVSSEMIHSQPLSPELVHSEPVSSEPEHLQQVSSEVVHSQPVCSESMNADTMGSEHADLQQVSSEVVHSQPVCSEPMNADTMGSEHADSQPATTEPANPDMVTIELMSSDHANSQLVNTEPMNSVTSEPAHVEPESSEPIHVEPVSPEPAHDEPVSCEPASVVPVHVELVCSEPAHAEPVHVEPVSSEPVHVEPVSSEPVHVAPVCSEPFHVEPVSSEPIHSDPASSDPIHLDPVNSEPSHSNSASSATVHSEPQKLVLVRSELEGLGTMPSQLVSSNVVHSQPFGSELLHSQPVSSETMTVESMSSEHANSQAEIMEAAVSQPIKTERIVNVEQTSPAHANSQPVSTKFMSTDPMVTDSMSLELGHPQPIGPELVYSQPLSSEMVYSQPLGSEVVHSHPVSLELIHSQPVGLELAHFQPLNSELVYSQGISFEPVHLQLVDSEMVNSQQLVRSEMDTSPLVTSEPLNSETVDLETQPSKRRKKKSIVWEHFTIETVGAGCRRACCKVCKQSFAYSTGSKVAGTSHLKRHIAKGTCPVILRQQEKNQLTPYMPKSGGIDSGPDPPKRRYRSSTSPYLIFNQDRCRHEIARMIIMHDYPLHMVEHPGFVAFVQNLQPRFDMVNFNTVQGDCVATYLREKQNLQRFIDGLLGRICLTLDVWTSSQTTGYVFLTGQFIDNDWKLHRRLLNVVMEPFPETDTALSHAVATCLSYWNLDNKLSSITVNQPLKDAGVENLRALLSVKNSQIFNGQLLIRNCVARTLSSMAQEVFAAGQDTIRKIRASVKYVKTSETHEEKFLELKQQLQVPTEKSLSLDNLTQWNTTYQMLLAAFELKEVFCCLDTSDPEYKDVPSMDDWKQVESLCMQLKLLCDTAKLLTAKTSPPSNIFFHEVWKIQLELARSAASDDPFVRNLSMPMQEKIQKYWKDCCLVLAIAVAMDPRFKMKLVEFSFTKIFGEQAPAYIRVVDDGIHELFLEYLSLPPVYAEDGNTVDVKMEQQEGGILVSSNGLSDFDMYIMETSSQQSKSELDQYLEESLLPRVQDFDVLSWWKLNKLKYPILSKMARDILSIPLSTMGPDLVFDVVSKEMDQYRSSLRPETMEALICAKDWLQYESLEASNAIVKMEL
ncbi:hypothetical protein Nepgr_032528 [Nepenthes gracilis]|uniref:BED-type domain-containing protein n=1 Tax=Nepenthes gracilis TaxID=150966 RepID=A0AAD3TJF1_NEPGR|nr:hypothetical protein Nepgr_032528 [Nepenthes gracilis]